MNLKQFNPLAQKIIRKQMKTKGYSSAEAVITAALALLDQQEDLQFPKGYLARLVAEAEEDMKVNGTLDGEKVFAEFRARRKQRKAS